MKNDKEKIEALQISVYCNVICYITSKHKNLSLIKLIVYSYLIKQNKVLEIKAYDGRDKKELVYKSLSLLAGDYASFCSNIPYILKSIDLLITTKKIIDNNGLYSYIGNANLLTNICEESTFISKAIEESYVVNDVQFLKEVIYNV